MFSTGCVLLVALTVRWIVSYGRRISVCVFSTGCVLLVQGSQDVCGEAEQDVKDGQHHERLRRHLWYVVEAAPPGSCSSFSLQSTCCACLSIWFHFFLQGTSLWDVYSFFLTDWRKRRKDRNISSWSDPHKVLSRHTWSFMSFLSAFKYFLFITINDNNNYKIEQPPTTKSTHAPRRRKSMQETHPWSDSVFFCWSCFPDMILPRITIL